MKRSVIETVLGALVLFLAAFFLVFSYNSSNVSAVEGYELVADFSTVGGLKAGDDVQISGVKIGSVKRVDLNPESYLARVTVSVRPNVRLPDDTAALISSESLLGGRYMALEPGASEKMLKPGGRVPFTQAPQNLEELLGKFIFSMQGGDKDKDKKAQDGNAASPAPTVAGATPAASAAPGGAADHP